MTTHKLEAPIRIGDVVNGVTVDKLELVSIAINFQPMLDTPKGGPAHMKYWRDRVAVSCMLRHPDSNWIHTVTLSEHTRTCKINGCPCKDDGYHAEEMWVALKKIFPDLEKEMLKLLQAHLPPGAITE